VSEAASDTVVVQATPEAVMAVVADFPSYPQWQSEVTDVAVLDVDEHGRSCRVRFSVDMRLFETSFVLDYRHGERELHWTLVEGEHVSRNEGACRLRDRDDGATEVTYEVEIEPSVAMPAAFMRKVAQRIVDGALSGMKHRVETLPC